MTPQQCADVDELLAAWMALESDDALGNRILAPQVLVGDPNGTHVLPRAAFLTAIAARATDMTDGAESAGAQTSVTLVGWEAQALGSTRALVTARWDFTYGTGGNALVIQLWSDLLVAWEDGRAVCHAYLARQSLPELLASEIDKP